MTILQQFNIEEDNQIKIKPPQTFPCKFKTTVKQTHTSVRFVLFTTLIVDLVDITQYKLFYSSQTKTTISR